MTDKTVTEQEIKKALAFQIGTKSVALSYVLWFFLGALGAHRMYLGKVASGIVMALLTIFSGLTFFFGIGMILSVMVLIWWIYDFFMIFFAAKKHNAIHKSLAN